MNKIVTYVKESYYELVNKVSWPTRSEVISSSVVVLSASVIIAIVILLMDMLFGQLVMPMIYGTF
ncbi:MAG: preprotein translocase subunit SecE [Bacteroidales bacterium]|jgi:preprotein translocase subunit SecE|nr:preprotein translocase subunit SecE [Bacteroidales bacterium]MCR5361835.1 preprotein translocase subunit SecE [Bacteroidales bacterium]